MGIPERKEREFLRREQEILDAAMRLFSRDDWQAVTIEEIAQASEIGKGTIYKHFPSKEDIYARFALVFNRKLLDRLRTVDTSQDTLMQLRSIIRAFWEFHLSSPEYHHLVQYCGREDFRRTVSEETRAEILELDQEFNILIAALVQAGIEEGVFPRNKPLPLLLFGAQAALFGAVRMAGGGCAQLMGTETTSEEFLEELTEFIVTGLTQARQQAQR